MDGMPAPENPKNFSTVGMGNEDTMSETNGNKKYEPYAIPGRKPAQESGAVQPSRPMKTDRSAESEMDKFAEIEISGINNKTSAEAGPKPQEIAPATDEKRRVFSLMRQIADEKLSRRMGYSDFLNRQTHHENSTVFYKQAIFMKDFDDDFGEQVSFSSYYPYYQLMSYAQLRTYFAWRTQVRKGNVTNTSASYVFLYIYELLNNVGVSDPQDGLDKLMTFWNAFKVHDASIDQYVLKWIKDYHIYYELPKSLRDFVHENNIFMHYPELAGLDTEDGDRFLLFCGISKYDIRQSVFYTKETSGMVRDCFCFVMDALNGLLSAAGMNLDELVFQPTKSNSVWMPFGGALFFPWQNQHDRRVVISEKEVYVCSQNQWSFRSSLIVESSRQFIGYIMKQMECVLRKATRFKYKLSANPGQVSGAVRQRLDATGISLEKAIEDAVLGFLTALNRTVVSVDKGALDKIRQEALHTQEKLIVPDIIEKAEGNASVATEDGSTIENQVTDRWASLKQTLTETEMGALAVALRAADFKQFSDANGIMAEVLADSINQKALDTVNDNILNFDDGVTVYEEYKEELMRLVGC